MIALDILEDILSIAENANPAHIAVVALREVISQNRDKVVSFVAGYIPLSKEEIEVLKGTADANDIEAIIQATEAKVMAKLQPTNNA